MCKVIHLMFNHIHGKYSLKNFSNITKQKLYKLQIQLTEINDDIET